MFRTLFLILLLVPAVELYVLIQVGSVIGALPTILLTIGTALLGAALMRSQGLMTLQQLQVGLAMGQPVEREVIRAGLIVVGGMLLLIPGFITDTLGLLLLLPPVQDRLAARLVVRSGHSRTFEADVTVVDGEVVRCEPDQPPALRDPDSSGRRDEAPKRF